ncbi:PP2C family protein-serine/threonine phosphatase [Marinobacterium mangrovicola]|uniref:Sigma-B regulation protein RsbU (Phosphoserine phosphatase) n=1 Tax=Marinobacterium mangrovicola TaxID=1476959 RepID=A0A4R1GJK2_9GAMM|nr:SpoIIE family protein phosphatase [Marinobacterium mangrovicola]TCK08567.1 sigma-B regulation protein RsbU (phosphoserine phosphatase) [Marinobacterium mangrovicola]
MVHREQAILAVSASTDVIDHIFELCEQCPDVILRLLVARGADDVESVLEHHEISLAIVDRSTFSEIEYIDHLAARISPMSTVVLIPDGTAEEMVAALRNGADDVFSLAELHQHPQLFIGSLQRQLERIRMIEEARFLRESLERSLDELKEDQHAAQQLQQKLLPPPSRELNQILFQYVLQPSLLLSGDFVDSIAINENQTIFYLADVSGHGASSALVTVLLKNMTYRLMRNYNRNSSFDIQSPLATLHRVNRELLLTGLGKHLTMFIGLIDARDSSLTYAIGGHHPMPVLSQKGEVSFLEGRGMPIGLFEKPMFDEKRIELASEYSITLFSDGILEVAEGDSLEEKEQKLLEACSGKHLSPQSICDSIVPVGRVNPDDVAIMTVSRV